MESIKRINEQLAIVMGQVTLEQLQQAAQEGYKSVLNLRSPDEEGFLSNEQQQAESTGLTYINIPVKPDGISNELAAQIFREIDQLPKPALIHCKSGMRSGAVTLMYIASQQGMSVGEDDRAAAMGKQNDFDRDAIFR